MLYHLVAVDVNVLLISVVVLLPLHALNLVLILVLSLVKRLVDYRADVNGMPMHHLLLLARIKLLLSHLQAMLLIVLLELMRPHVLKSPAVPLCPASVNAPLATEVPIILNALHARVASTRLLLVLSPAPNVPRAATLPLPMEVIVQ